MANAITHALLHVRNTIPEEILNKVFISNINHNNLIPIDVNSIIKEQVISNIVLPNLNLVVGVQERINLTGLQPIYQDMMTMVINVPKSLTQGKSIMEALSVEYGTSIMGTNIGQPTLQTSQLLGAANNLLNSINGVTITSTANVTLIGENTIMIKEGIRWIGNLTLVCYLENDSNLNSIPHRAFILFAEIVELAVKAYIYNKTIVLMDRAQIYAGHELGAFKDTIMDYRDANREFMEKIKTDWSKAMYLADENTKRNLIRLQFGRLV